MTTNTKHTDERAEVARKLREADDYAQFSDLPNSIRLNILGAAGLLEADSERIALLEATLESRERNIQMLVDENRRLLEADAQAKGQEAVYWQWRKKSEAWCMHHTYGSPVFSTTNDTEVRPLYTAPPAQPAREWVGLTDDEVTNFLNLRFLDHTNNRIAYVRKIESKLREKNAS